MLSALLGLAALVAVVVTAARALRQRAAERARPGRSPASAIPIADFGDMDLAVQSQLCACGGRFGVRGEGPVARETRPLRVAHLECQRCERERRLYFDLSTVRH